MNKLKAVLLGFLIFSAQVQSMQFGERIVEKLSRVNLQSVRKFSSYLDTQENMLNTISYAFKGSKPKRQFSAKDLVRDDTVGRLTTYAKPINYEGTLLKVKKQESHKESENLRQFSVLRAPGLFDNRILDGLLSLYDRRDLIREPYVYPHYLTGFLLTEFKNGIYQRGSGLLIGNRYGLTAKHCLFRMNERGEMKEEAKGGEFLLGASGNSVLKKTILKDWKSHESRDVAIFEIDRPVGEELGWASLRALKASEVMENPFEVSVTGYPAYKRFFSYYTKQEKELFTMRGPVNKVTNGSIYYDIDTSGGQSGAGITRFEDDILESYGVHTTGTKNPVEGNEGVRVDDDLLSFTLDFIRSKK